MGTTPQLSWINVRLAVMGIAQEEALKAVQDLQDELDARSHLRDPKVFWETETKQVIVQVDAPGLTPASAAGQMAEELFEVACAVLEETDGMQIKILES
jgi:hypothetical protein